MSNILTLNQPFVSVGLTAFTFTLPSTGLYSVIVQAQVPEALQTGAGSGTARDQGNGVTGGTQGIGQGSNLSLGNGGTGLGFGAGATSDNASGFASGYGAGAGGGGEGFVAGDQGLGKGGVGQGFGTGNGYPQPPTDVHSSQTTGAAVSSGVSVVVAQNSTPIFTSPAFSPTQSAQQFKVEISGTANDTITVTPSSSTASDKQLNGTQFTVTLQQGF